MAGENGLNIGGDGFAYFHYGLGARYRICPPHTPPFVYEITDMEYESGKEYYTLSVDGKGLANRYSLTELELLLTRFEWVQTSEGEAVELPLLKEEVIRYYEDKRKQLKAENSEANRKLKSTQYFNLLNAKYAQERKMRLSLSEGKEEEARESRDRIAELEAGIDKILEACKVDKKVLHKVKECEVCGDTGIVNGAICDCAYARYDPIKTYAAILRLSGKEV